MKKSFAFYLKTALLLIGVILIVIAGFSPVQSQLQFKESESFEDTIDVFEYGFSNFLWYILVFFTLVIFSIGYFFNGLANRILVYVFTPLLALIFLFISAISTVTWGATPFIPQFEYGYMLMVFGALLVIAATTISVHRKTTTVVTSLNSDLLDDN